MPKMSQNLRRYFRLHQELEESEYFEPSDDNERDEAFFSLNEIELDLLNAIWSYEHKLLKIEELENE